MSAFYLSLVIFCQTIPFSYRSGQLKWQFMIQSLFTYTSGIFFYSYFNLFFHDFVPYLLTQNISLFLLRVKLVFLLSPSCVKWAPRNLTGTKHMAFEYATSPGDLRGWAALLCAGLSMSPVNWDGHCQTADTKGEGSWQVLPCDYKSATVKVEKKPLLPSFSLLLFFKIEI